MCDLIEPAISVTSGLVGGVIGVAGGILAVAYQRHSEARQTFRNILTRQLIHMREFPDTFMMMLADEFKETRIAFDAYQRSAFQWDRGRIANLWRTYKGNNEDYSPVFSDQIVEKRDPGISVSSNTPSWSEIYGRIQDTLKKA